MATKQKQNGTVQEIDIETAQKIVEAAGRKQAEEFAKEYQALCEKYGLQLVPSVQLGIRKL